MRGRLNRVFVCLLAVLFVASLAAFSAAAPRSAGGQSPVSLGMPADTMWDAWYRDPRPRHGPEWHASTVAPDGTVVTVGSDTDFTVPSPITGELIVGKYDRFGHPLPGWPKFYTEPLYPWNEGQDVILDSSGNITICGYSIANNVWYASIWKMDSSGNMLAGWPRHANPVTRAWVMGLIVDSNGDIVCCGATGANMREQGLLVKYRQDGTPVPGWPKTFQLFAGGNLTYDLIQDTDGNLVVAGYSGPDADPYSNNRDAVLYKFDINGNLLPGWPKRWDSGTGIDDEYYSVSQDTNGDYCLVGTAGGTNDDSGRLLVTRWTRDGNQVAGWPQIYSMEGRRDASPPDAWHGSVDPSGNIVAAFTSDQSDVRTVKYTRSGEMFYGFPKILSKGGYYTATRSCGVDGQGNIYTVGFASSNADPEGDETTFLVKYPPEFAWYLAEGSTGSDGNGNFETWVLVQNPGEEVANVQLYYQTPGGEVPGHQITLQPHTRQTRNVAEFVPNEWSVSTKVVSDQPVIAERAMYWNNATSGVFRQAAHDSIGVTKGAIEWFLAEGSTGADGNGNFETWILVQNPGDEVANVQLYYQTPSGEVPGHQIALAPHSRQTRNVAEFVPNEWSVSTHVVSDKPVIAERAMYWNNTVAGVFRQAAHDSIGVTEGALEWFLAEGSTGMDGNGNFETWVLVQNPGDEVANVKLFYQTPAGEVPGQEVTLQPRSRQTRNVGQVVPNEWSVSTRVVSDKPVIAERAMYWHNGPAQVFRQAAHDSIGVTAPGGKWSLAEGSTGMDGNGNFETWILVQNPGDEVATAQIYYQTPTGQVTGQQVVLQPHSRQTRNVAEFVPNEWSVSAQVVSDKPVIAERAMYWNSATGGVFRQAAHDSIGYDDP